MPQNKNSQTKKRKIIKNVEWKSICEITLLNGLYSINHNSPFSENCVISSHRVLQKCV